MTKMINIYADPMMAHTHTQHVAARPFQSNSCQNTKKIVVMCPTIHQLNGPGGMNMYGHFNGIVLFLHVSIAHLILVPGTTIAP